MKERQTYAVSRAEKARRRALGAAFEEIVALAFEGEGLVVERHGLNRQGSRGDGGIDLFVWMPHLPDERTAVQCKALRSGEVGQGEIQRMIGIVGTEKNVTRGIVVTTATFTTAATVLAMKRPDIALIDGQALLDRWGIDANALHAQFPVTDSVVPGIAAAEAAEATTYAVISSSSNAPRGSSTVLHLPRGRRRLFWGAGVLLALAVIGGHMVSRVAPTALLPDANATDEVAVAPAVAAPAKSSQRASVARRSREKKLPETQKADPSPVENASPIVIYKSANMTDAEFAAWKIRRAQRDQKFSPAMEAEAADSPPPRDVPVSPETMRTILRTNGHE